MSLITTSELDALARRGLTDIEAIFDGKADEATVEKANLALRLLRISSGRYSAETNRMALGFRIAKALDVPKEDLVPMWRQLTGADPKPKAITAPDEGKRKPKQ